MRCETVSLKLKEEISNIKEINDALRCLCDLITYESPIKKMCLEIKEDRTTFVNCDNSRFYNIISEIEV